MTIPGEHRLSMAEIARRAGVQRPAVNNWQRRHDDFPAPVPGDESDVFDAAEIAVWLDRRRIPRNALTAGEAAGTSFGDRFRRTFASSAGAADEARAERTEGTDAHTPAKAIAELDRRIQRLMDRSRGSADISDYGDRVLGLLYLRCAAPDRWTDMVAGLRSPGGMVTRQLAEALREAGVDPADRPEPEARSLPDPQEEVFLRDLIALLDPVVDTGDAGREGRDADLVPLLFRRVLERLVTAEGRRGSEFYTPESITDLIAMMIHPKRDERVCDPCCGTGELLAAAATRDPGQRTVPVDGLALSSRSRRLATMNLGVRGVPARVDDSALAALRSPRIRGRYHVVVTNPPFNMSDRTRQVDSKDPRWSYGTPPVHNANFAWLQHVASLLVDGGRAAVVMSNNSTFSANPAERAIRAAMVEEGLVECVVALPPRLFATTGIPVTLWLLRNVRSVDRGVLFIDAGGLGRVRRAGRVLGSDDVGKITDTYRHWLRRGRDESFDAERGFARHADVTEVRQADYDLNPRRYVAPEADFDRGRLAEDVHRLQAELVTLRGRATAIDSRLAQLLEGFTPWTP